MKKSLISSCVFTLFLSMQNSYSMDMDGKNTQPRHFVYDSGTRQLFVESGEILQENVDSKRSNKNKEDDKSKTKNSAHSSSKNSSKSETPPSSFSYSLSSMSDYFSPLSFGALPKEEKKKKSKRRKSSEKDRKDRVVFSRGLQDSCDFNSTIFDHKFFLDGKICSTLLSLPYSDTYDKIYKNIYFCEDYKLSSENEKANAGLEIYNILIEAYESVRKPEVKSLSKEDREIEKAWDENFIDDFFKQFPNPATFLKDCKSPEKLAKIKAEINILAEKAYNSAISPTECSKIETLSSTQEKEEKLEIDTIINMLQANISDMLIQSVIQNGEVNEERFNQIAIKLFNECKLYVGKTKTLSSLPTDKIQNDEEKFIITRISNILKNGIQKIKENEISMEAVYRNIRDVAMDIYEIFCDLKNSRSPSDNELSLKLKLSLAENIAVENEIEKIIRDANLEESDANGLSKKTPEIYSKITNALWNYYNKQLMLSENLKSLSSSAKKEQYESLIRYTQTVLSCHFAKQFVKLTENKENSEKKKEIVNEILREIPKIANYYFCLKYKQLVLSDSRQLSEALPICDLSLQQHIIINILYKNFLNANKNDVDINAMYDQIFDVLWATYVGPKNFKEKEGEKLTKNSSNSNQEDICQDDSVMYKKIYAGCYFERFQSLTNKITKIEGGAWEPESDEIVRQIADDAVKFFNAIVTLNKVRTEFRRNNDRIIDEILENAKTLESETPSTSSPSSSSSSSSSFQTSSSSSSLPSSSLSSSSSSATFSDLQVDLQFEIPDAFLPEYIFAIKTRGLSEKEIALQQRIASFTGLGLQGEDGNIHDDLQCMLAMKSSGREPEAKERYVKKCEYNIEGQDNWQDAQALDKTHCFKDVYDMSSYSEIYTRELAILTQIGPKNTKDHEQTVPILNQNGKKQGKNDKQTSPMFIDKNLVEPKLPFSIRLYITPEDYQKDVNGANLDGLQSESTGRLFADCTLNVYRLFTQLQLLWAFAEKMEDLNTEILDFSKKEKLEQTQQTRSKVSIYNDVRNLKFFVDFIRDFNNPESGQYIIEEEKEATNGKKQKKRVVKFGTVTNFRKRYSFTPSEQMEDMWNYSDKNLSLVELQVGPLKKNDGAIEKFEEISESLALYLPSSLCTSEKIDALFARLNCIFYALEYKRRFEKYICFAYDELVSALENIYKPDQKMKNLEEKEIHTRLKNHYTEILRSNFGGIYQVFCTYNDYLGKEYPKTVVKQLVPLVKQKEDKLDDKNLESSSSVSSSTSSAMEEKKAKGKKGKSKANNSISSSSVSSSVKNNIKQNMKDGQKTVSLIESHIDESSINSLQSFISSFSSPAQVEDEEKEEELQTKIDELQKELEKQTKEVKEKNQLIETLRKSEKDLKKQKEQRAKDFGRQKNQAIADAVQTATQDLNNELVDLQTKQKPRLAQIAEHAEEKKEFEEEREKKEEEIEKLQNEQKKLTKRQKELLNKAKESQEQLEKENSELRVEIQKQKEVIEEWRINVKDLEQKQNSLKGDAIEHVKLLDELNKELKEQKMENEQLNIQNKKLEKQQEEHIKRCADLEEEFKLQAKEEEEKFATEETKLLETSQKQQKEIEDLRKQLGQIRLESIISQLISSSSKDNEKEEEKEKEEKSDSQYNSLNHPFSQSSNTEPAAKSLSAAAKTFTPTSDPQPKSASPSNTSNLSTNNKEVTERTQNHRLNSWSQKTNAYHNKHLSRHSRRNTSPFSASLSTTPPSFSNPSMPFNTQFCYSSYNTYTAGLGGTLYMPSSTKGSTSASLPASSHSPAAIRNLGSASSLASNHSSSGHSSPVYGMPLNNLPLTQYNTRTSSFPFSSGSVMPTISNLPFNSSVFGSTATAPISTNVSSNPFNSSASNIPAPFSSSNINEFSNSLSNNTFEKDKAFGARKN